MRRAFSPWALCIHCRRSSLARISSFPTSAPRHLSTAADMPRLNAVSQKAIGRLRAYKPPPTSYDLVPLSRRAAVLVLLYANAKGDLRVVLTIRASTLSSYAGQAALPGGKSDSLSETPLQTARREAHEEIGLPGENYPLPPPFTVEHLCEIPCSLARTELVVRPVVALLHSFDEKTGQNADPERELIPRLDAREVAAVFTAKFADFLKLKLNRKGEEDEEIDEGWYEGGWTKWYNTDWRMHQFHVPTPSTSVTKPHPKNPQQEEAERHLREKETQTENEGGVSRYTVWGMTARILVDVARIAYDAEPEFEHNTHSGDEELITRLRGMGRLEAKI